MTNWDLRGYSRVAGAGKEYGINRKKPGNSSFSTGFVPHLFAFSG
jgi:hypothetical protein